MTKKSNQRADVFNPNNPAYKAAKDNYSNQKNPTHAPTKPVPPVGAKTENSTPNRKK
ncbi:MAG: hypothetical protein L6Q81_05045 [Bacteroidia bacterium]|nr:hypothetical protein [Bacteroidia bacterium]